MRVIFMSVLEEFCQRSPNAIYRQIKSYRVRRIYSLIPIGFPLAKRRRRSQSCPYMYIYLHRNQVESNTLPLSSGEYFGLFWGGKHIMNRRDCVKSVGIYIYNIS